MIEYDKQLNQSVPNTCQRGSIYAADLTWLACDRCDR